LKDKNKIFVTKLKGVLKNKINKVISKNNEEKFKPNKLNQILSLVFNKELLEKYEKFEVIVDTGCANSTSLYIEDFEPNSLKKLDKPLIIERIGANIKVENMVN